MNVKEPHRMTCEALLLKKMGTVSADALRHRLC